MKHRFSCKVCGKEFYTAEGAIFHILFAEKDGFHNIHWGVALRECLLIKVVSLCLYSIAYIGWLITYPFAIAHAYIEDKIG